MSLRSHKTVEIMVYLNFLLDNRRIRIRIKFLEAQKHTDSADPDPEHWMKYDSFAAFN
jgi:hypothetical protein